MSNWLDKETHSKGNKGVAKAKDAATTEKAMDIITTREEKEQKENTQQMFVCYRCGQPGHMAKQCRAATSTPTTRQITWHNHAHNDSPGSNTRNT